MNKPLSELIENQYCAVNLREPSEGDLERVKRECDRMRAISVILAKALEQIRSYSLGSKADICDEAFAEARKLMEKK